MRHEAPTAKENQVAGRTERKTIPIRVPEDMHQELKTLAFFTGRSINDIVTGLIGEHLAGPGRQLIEHGMTMRARTNYKDALDKLAEM